MDGTSLALIFGAVLVIPVVALVLFERRKRRQQRNRLTRLNGMIHTHRLFIDRCITRDFRKKDCITFARESLKRAVHALEFDRLFRAETHIRMAGIVLDWVVVLQRNARADSGDGSGTNDLILGLTLVRNQKHTLAADHFEKLWIEDGIDIHLKACALRSHAQSLRDQGRAHNAEVYEQLAMGLPKLYREYSLHFKLN